MRLRSTGRDGRGAKWRHLACAAVALGILAGCAGPTPAPAPPTAKATGPTAIAHAAEIRFGLIGQLTQTNVWALFDSSGYSYNNYAVRSGYWPRLYDLSIPEYEFEARAASGDPSPVRQEGGFYTATLGLNPSLKWSDGAPFTAEDVAFTANTALAFQLGFDWQTYYNPAWLDHVEAIDAHTVKYYFKQAPNVGVWQYGVLQGPVAQDKFWSTKVAAASALLPDSAVSAEIATLNAKVADLEKQVGVLNYSAITSQGEGARVVQSGLKRQMGDLDQAINDLDKAQATYDAAMQAARAALYETSDQGEPLLGALAPVQQSGNSTYESKFNPSYPGPSVNFDRVVYKLFATRSAADAALRAGQVDMVLDGATPSAAAETGSETRGLMTSPTRSMRFLVLNLQSDPGASQPLRKALACMIDQSQLVGGLGGRGVALNSYVAPQETTWYNPDAHLPCYGLDEAGRLAQAVQFLKSGGFTWTQEPTAQVDGSGLAGQSGRAVPTLGLLVSASDTARSAAAAYVQQEARKLGLGLTVQAVSEDVVDFDVFSSQRFDAALVGWKVSLYPGYLCDWFGAGKPFQYPGSAVVADCGRLEATSSLEVAAQAVFDMQKNLAEDVPFIPLYSESVQEVRANVNYPFQSVLGGLAETYGAPNLAYPQSP